MKVVSHPRSMTLLFLLLYMTTLEQPSYHLRSLAESFGVFFSNKYKKLLHIFLLIINR